MRILFWYCDRMAWTPTSKTIEDVPNDKAGEVEKAIAAYIHIEPSDEERAGKMETRLMKNVKWLAGKWDTKLVVLHSFAHLARIYKEF